MDTFAFILTFLVGVACVIIGVLNRRGNVKMLHSYHYKRVKPEDILPFGKLVGFGMIIFGVSIIIFSIMSGISIYIEKEMLVFIGAIIMIVGMIIGSIIMFYAMKKYNKGIF